AGDTESTRRLPRQGQGQHLLWIHLQVWSRRSPGGILHRNVFDGGDQDGPPARRVRIRDEQGQVRASSGDQCRHIPRHYHTAEPRKEHGGGPGVRKERAVKRAAATVAGGRDREEPVHLHRADNAGSARG
ncbi:unnamed protein product, partial [Ectocarpus fasciculatus]